jgi:mono/diheme cytochrome c family protein
MESMSFKFALIALGLAAAGVYSIQAQDATKSVWDGVYTDTQAKKGQATYSMECASCHGDQLTGGEMAPPLAGGEFMSNWSGLTVGDLFERIRTGMPPSDPNRLNRETKADVVAFILAFNKFPAGKQEMPSRTEMLKQIKIEADKK